MVVILSDIQKRIIRTLLQADNNNEVGLTRKSLSERLDMARTTLYDNLSKLQKIKLVEKYSHNNGKVGRPLILWHIMNKEL